MLWYKAWLETRWRFVVALLIGATLSLMTVLVYPALRSLQVDISTVPEPFRELAREGLALSTTYKGYIWSQWFGKNFLQVWIFFAVLIGVGGVVTESSRGSALWTLSLPVSRARLLGVRAAVGALELLVLAVAPSLLIPLLSPVVGESYGLTTALAFSLMAFAAGLAFYCLSLLLSTIFTEQLKPVIVGLAVAFGLSLASLFSKWLADRSIFTVMSGEQYFKQGVPAWMGLAVYLAASVVMFLVSLRILARRDF